MKQQVNISLSYATSYGKTFEEFASDAAAAGFDGVQLIPDQEPNLYSEFTPTRTRELRRLLNDLSLEVSVHNVFYDINIVSVVPEVRELAFSITRQVLAMTRTLGGRILTVHPGYMFGGWRRDTIQAEHFWKQARLALERLGELSREYEIEIALENGSYYLCTATGDGRVPLHVGISPDEIRRLLRLSGWSLAICLDVNKAIRSGYEIKDFIDSANERICQVQISTVAKHEAEVREVLGSLVQEGKTLEVVLEGSPSEASKGKVIVESIRRGLGP